MHLTLTLVLLGSFVANLKSLVRGHQVNAGVEPRMKANQMRTCKRIDEIRLGDRYAALSTSRAILIYKIHDLREHIEGSSHVVSI